MRFFQLVIFFSLISSFSVQAKMYSYRSIYPYYERYGIEPIRRTAIGDIFEHYYSKDGRYTFSVSLFNFTKEGLTISSSDNRIKIALLPSNSCGLLKNAGQLSYFDSLKFSEKDFSVYNDMYKGFLVTHNIESGHYGLAKFYKQDRNSIDVYIQADPTSDDLSEACADLDKLPSFYSEDYPDVRKIKPYNSPWMNLREALLTNNNKAISEALQQASTLKNNYVKTWIPSSIFEGKFGPECKLKIWTRDEHVLLDLLFLAVVRNDVEAVKKMVQLDVNKSVSLTINQGELRGTCSGNWIKESGWISLSIIDYAKLQGYQEILEILE